jgi:mono/diheme cytochrome c family protein
MKTFGRTALWLSITTLFAAGAFSAVQDLPEGQGRNLLEVSCVSCHNLDRVKRTHVDRDGWNQIIQTMIEKRDGPILSEQDVKDMLDYLVKNLGPANAAPAAGAAAGGEAEAKQVLQNSCSGCHGLDLIDAKRADKAGWTDIVQRMVGMGAQLTDAQSTMLIDYLAKTYPPGK